MKVKLLRPWKNGSKIYTAGACFEMKNDSDARKLISDGTAEKYDSDAEINERLKLDGSFNPNRGLTFGDDGSQTALSAKQFWGVSDDYQSNDDSGFKNFADFCMAVKSGHDPRLSELVQKDLSEGIDSEGGFTVPTQFRDQLITEMLANAHLLNRLLNIPMQHSSISIPAIYDVNRSTTGMHGVTVPVSVSEAGALTDMSPTFSKITLKLQKLGGRCRVSNEMMADSPLAMSMLLPRIFSEAISFELIDQLINGTGVGQMLGILNAPATIQIAKEAAQTADTICWENIVKMWSRLMPSAKRSAIWIASPDAEVEIRSISLAVGTAGAALMAVNASESQPSMLFGRPLFFVEQCPILGDVGDICVFNPTAYAMGKKQNDPIKIDISEHSRFENDQTVFRALARCDGQPLQSSPITPKNGGDELSHFVTLAERA